jgi:hypothetical protein
MSSNMVELWVLGVPAFYGLVAIPWGIILFLIARRRVVDPTSRDRLGPLTLLSIVAAVFGMFPGMYVVTDVIAGKSKVWSPLALAVSGAPSLWYLWRERKYRLVLALLMVPTALTGSCIAISR